MAPRHPRVALTNLGCRVNRVELDVIAKKLELAGCVVAPEAEAELVVVNTCAVTGEAEAKARKAVRHAAALPQAPIVLATGCVASLFADELSGLAGNVFVEPNKGQVPAQALELLGVPAEVVAGGNVPAGTDAVVAGPAGSSASGPVIARTGVAFAPDHAVTPTGRMRPGLKIQDGCDHRCTYCIVWKARGRASSLDANEVISEVHSLVADGAQEVVLTGIDLGRYESGGLALDGLLSRILNETEVGRVRLSSIEPAGVTPELLEVMANSHGRVAPFLHIPLQSGCDATLRRMGRPYTVADYLAVVRSVREALPGAAVACDLIVGFPGEDEREFAESLETCREVGFAKMHVFRYSKRPGTPAATMPAQVAPGVSVERSREMRELAARTRRAWLSTLVGTEQLVLVERGTRGVSGGLADVLVPEGHAGELISVVPHGLTDAGSLDAR